METPKTPKWEFFERLEKLEPKLERLEPQVDDIAKIGVVTFRLVFISLLRENPDYARKIKDIVVKMLKEVGLRRSVEEEIEGYMLSMCEEVEKLG
jgi:hypothetical protein